MRMQMSGSLKSFVSRASLRLRPLLPYRRPCSQLDEDRMRSARMDREEDEVDEDEQLSGWMG